MIQFRVRWRTYENRYPAKTYYAVNLHSIDVDEYEQRGTHLGMLRMTREEFTLFRDALELGMATDVTFIEEGVQP